ncbi:MAG: hypothetical protein IT427_19015 [Pirellulales bacterium]|nr:hypothetical protein [Pirellulales bacterium]
MSKFHFSTKRLFLCVALIAIACTIWFYADQGVGTVARKGGQRINDEVAFFMLYSAMALAGFGIGILFKRPVRGILIGSLCFVIFFIYALLHSMWKWR